MYQAHKDRADFVFVYIREAHPQDGWQLDANVADEVVYAEPTTWSQRQGIAQASCQRLALSMPVVVDTMDNTVDEKYGGWPERIFVVDRDGRIAYAGKQGPWGFKPKEAEKALKRLLRAS